MAIFVSVSTTSPTRAFIVPEGGPGTAPTFFSSYMARRPCPCPGCVGERVLDRPRTEQDFSLYIRTNVRAGGSNTTAAKSRRHRLDQRALDAAQGDDPASDASHRSSWHDDPGGARTSGRCPVSPRWRFRGKPTRACGWRNLFQALCPEARSSDAHPGAPACVNSLLSHPYRIGAIGHTSPLGMSIRGTQPPLPPDAMT